MKKILISIIIFSFLLCGCQKTTPLSHKEFCLDTIVQITLYDSSSKNILNNCFNLCKKYELVFSANNKESELYKINHAHHKLDEQPLSSPFLKFSTITLMLIRLYRSIIPYMMYRVFE